MKKPALAIIPATIFLATTMFFAAAMFIAAMPIAAAHAQPAAPKSAAAPADDLQGGDSHGGDPHRGEWVSGRHITVGFGCLKIWLCDCSKVKLPRNAWLERIPPTDTAGLCKAEARGECTVCEAPPPKKKCECKAQDR